MLGSGPFRTRALSRVLFFALIAITTLLIVTACENPASSGTQTIVVSGTVQLRTLDPDDDDDDAEILTPIPSAIVEAYVGTTRVGETTTNGEGSYRITATGSDLSSVSIVVSVEGFDPEISGFDRIVYAGAARTVSGSTEGLAFTFDEDDDWFPATRGDDENVAGFFRITERATGTDLALSIANVFQLQLIELASIYGSDTNNYTFNLVRPINAAATGLSEWGSWTGTNNGFKPILSGGSASYFTIDGQGFAISDLFIGDWGGSVGLTGQIGENNEIKNLVLENITINSPEAGLGSGSGVGSIAGLNDGGTISNVRITGTLTGGSRVGGVVGTNQNGGVITNAVVAADVSSKADVEIYAGGIVAWFGGESDLGIVSSQFSGDVRVAAEGEDNAGLLVGVTKFTGATAEFLTAGISSSTGIGRVVDSATDAQLHARLVGSLDPG